MENTTSQKEYWASLKSSEDCVSKIVTKIKDYRAGISQAALDYKIKRSWDAYRGSGPNGDADSSTIGYTGQTGELLQMTVNEFSSMVTKTVALITQTKPAVKAIAANSDFESLGQAQFAEALNDYYDRELAVSDRENEAVLTQVLMGESWIVEDWNPSGGDPYMTDEDGKVLRTGDVQLFTLTPFDVARPLNIPDLESLTWLAWRHKVNKYDLAAQYSDMADEITSFNGTLGDLDDQKYNLFQSATQNPDDEDYVWLWEFRHIPTPALKNGRLIRFLDSKTVLYDSVKTTPAHTEIVQLPTVNEVTGQVEVNEQEQFVDETTEDFGYPYGNELFAFSSSPERLTGTSLGHTPFWDLLSLQEGIDLSSSIISSAINAGGLQNIYVPRGAGITVDKMSGGLNVIEYSPEFGIPKAESNLAINPLVLQWSDKLIGYMQTRVSLNDVVTGNPSAGMPAQAMALLRAQAIEFHSRLQAAYERMVQRVRTGIIKLLQMYAEQDRVALIAGKANAWALKEFKKQDIQGFDRFIIEPINPVMKTLSGKVSIALPLLEKGLVNPQQYLQLLSTGRLDPITKFSADNQARIEREKELLLQGVGMPPYQLDPMGNTVKGENGIPVFNDDPSKTYIRPLISDTFWSSIPEYLSVIAMPEVRSNVTIVKNTLELVDYCMKLWKIQPPAMTQVLNGIPFMDPQVAPGAGPMPSNESTGVPPVQTQGQPAPVPQGSPAINLPKTPTLKNVDPNLQAVSEGDVINRGK